MRRSSAQCLCDCRAFKSQWTTFGASGVSGRTSRTRSTAAIGRSVAVALVRSLRIRNVSVQHLARLLGAPNFRSRLKIDLWRRFDATLALGVVNQLVGVESRGKLSAGGTERAGGRDRGADFVGPVHRWGQSLAKTARDGGTSVRPRDTQSAANVPVKSGPAHPAESKNKRSPGNARRKAAGFDRGAGYPQSPTIITGRTFESPALDQ
jgi:hypothetical protein